MIVVAASSEFQTVFYESMICFRGDMELLSVLVRSLSIKNRRHQTQVSQFCFHCPISGTNGTARKTTCSPGNLDAIASALVCKSGFRRAKMWSLFEVDRANIRRESGVPFLVCPISSTLVNIKRRLTSVLSFTAMLDCHCAGRLFWRTPLLIIMQHWANSIQNSSRQPIVYMWLAGNP